MEKQQYLEPWLTASSQDHHHLDAALLWAQLWTSATEHIGSESRGPFWLELINYSTFTLLLLVIFMSAARLTILAIRCSGEGQVKLSPDISGTNPASTRKEVFAQALLDNLDHGLSADGDPLDLDAFWRGVSSDLNCAPAYIR